MKATGFAWFYLPLTLLLLTSYWCAGVQANGECAKEKCNFSEGDAPCGLSCRCYSDPENPEHPTIGVCAPSGDNEIYEAIQQPYRGSSQGGYYEGGAGMGAVGAVTDGLLGTMQNRQFAAGAVQPGIGQPPHAPAPPASAPNSPSPKPPTPPPGTTSGKKPPLPPKLARTAQSLPQRLPFPPPRPQRLARPSILRRSLRRPFGRG